MGAVLRFWLPLRTCETKTNTAPASNRREVWVVHSKTERSDTHPLRRLGDRGVLLACSAKLRVVGKHCRKFATGSVDNPSRQRKARTPILGLTMLSASFNGTPLSHRKQWSLQNTQRKPAPNSCPNRLACRQAGSVHVRSRTGEQTHQENNYLYV